ncbi:MAG: hypothetical protein KU29_11185 [Sulfurovum sp. FS06-10]|nr:MAG: hypothetical protein KU29_11185 [Sulfurovum sp. FS06-10]
MATKFYIDKILSSPIQVFNEIIEELLRVQVNIDALILSIERLEELEEGIFNKNFYILNKELSKKSDFYIAEIQKNIKELKYYKTFLESKFNDLNDTKKVHLRLFKKIPRYYELSGAHQHLQLEK